MHKNLPWVKPFIITATDGYIVYMVGPFFANGRNTDASIPSDMVKTNAGNLIDFFLKNKMFWSFTEVLGIPCDFLKIVASK